MNTFNDITNSKTPVLVDFYADWCQPCKMMAPILKQVKDAMGEEVRIIKINTETNQSLAMQYQIRSIPTMLLFKEGKVVWQTSGVMQARPLIETIKRYSG